MLKTRQKILQQLRTVINSTDSSQNSPQITVKDRRQGEKLIVIICLRLGQV